MRFLVDANLPKALTGWLVAQGHDAEHVLSLSMGQARDDVLWRLATDMGAVIISKDEDFAVLARTTDAGPAVVWVRTGNGTNADLLNYLAPLWAMVRARLQAGDRLVELR